MITKNDGSPFPTKRSATLRSGVLRKQGKETRVIEVEGGYALEEVSSPQTGEATEVTEVTEASTAKKRRRKKRAKLGQRNVLTFPQIPGYATQIVNDVRDHIFRAEENDWEIVQNAELPAGDRRAGAASRMGEPVRVPVGEGADGQPMYGVLMKKPIEWHKEDMEEEQALIKQREDQMKHDKGGIPGGYGEIRIT